MKHWTRSDTLALALDSCTTCRGTGILIGSKAALRPCNCVLRTIFRVCYDRFVYCSYKEKHLSHTKLETGSTGDSAQYRWGRKDEEYVADFYLTSKRTLEPGEWDLFRFHFLLGADWRLCCRRLNLDRGTFFHSVYRIEQKLGRVYKELEPYALFPLDEYFGGCVSSFESESALELEFDDDTAPGKPEKRVIPIRPPVKRQAVELPEEKAA